MKARMNECMDDVFQILTEDVDRFANRRHDRMCVHKLGDFRVPNSFVVPVVVVNATDVRMRCRH
jgi:hypothetical protein